MRKKLERNLAYHAAMAEYYGDRAKQAESQAPTGNARSTRPTASASPPKPDNPAKVLADLHAGVVAQLQPILDAAPVIPAIVQASATRMIRRNESPDLKPAAGIFH
jgi:hypothetical protein